MMKGIVSLLNHIHLLRASFFALLVLTLVLHAILSTTPALLNEHSVLLLVSRHKVIVFFVLWCTLVALLRYLAIRPRSVLLLDYSCFKPDYDRKCSYEVARYFVGRSRRFTTKSEEFMQGIYLKSGLGDETYCPPFIFEADYEPRLLSAFQEADEGMFTAVDNLLSKTRVSAALIDVLIVTGGMFASSPSLASRLVHRYRLRDDVRTYNLTGMGCSSGAASIDLAARLLRSRGRASYSLVVVTEILTPNWYFGNDRSMLVTNCIFRVGCAAALLTNDPKRRCDAKFELSHALRTHNGADEAAYRAAFQEEDESGTLGVSLKKDLIRVAGVGLKSHIRVLAPRVLPFAQQVQYVYRLAARRVAGGGRAKSHVPDFTTAFEHMCIHTGGKAVIESMARLMRLGEHVTEPARMSLHRFGNTSSSLVFYELAYFEAKGRVRAGDRLWMLAFGTGFKVCSLVWRALRDSCMDPDNPWIDCIHRYPLKAW